MNKFHLTYLQVATLCFFLVNSFTVTFGYNFLTNINNTDSIFDVLLGGGIILIYALVIMLLKNKNQNKNLIDLINDLGLVKWLVFPILIIILFVTTIYSLNIVTSFINLYILKEVKSLIIMVTFISVALYLVKKEIATITKVSEILFYVYLMLVLFGILGLFNKIDFSNIKPLFTSSFQSHIKSSFTYFISSIVPLFLIFMIPENTIKSKKGNNRLPIYFILLSIILMFTQFIIILSVLGIHLTNIYVNPEMIAYKKISFLNVLDRVEVILSFNYILNIFFLLVMCFYTINKITNKIIKTKKENINITLLGFISLFLANSFSINKDIYIFINFICFIIFVFLLIKFIIYKCIHLISN